MLTTPDKMIYMIRATDAERRAAIDLARALLPRGVEPRPVDVLHCTLILAGLFEDPGARKRALQVGTLARGNLFRLVFDRLQWWPGGIAVLTCSDRGAAFDMLRQQLAGARIGRTKVGGDGPHVTLAYKCPEFPSIQLQEPLVWLADEFQLVRSLEGQTRYEELDRWPLK